MFRVGVDLGGTNISVGIINDEFKIIGRANTKTNAPRKEEEIFDDIIKTVNDVCENADVELGDVKSIGIGAPGSVNPKTGVVEYCNNLGFKNAPMKEYIQSRFKKSVYVANDANCAALAEKMIGTGIGTTDFIAITLGTGIGGGIFVNNKMLTGVNGAAGEVGHMVIDLNGVNCNCSRVGCFEQYASAMALIAQTKEALQKDINKTSVMWKLINNNLSNVNGKTAFDAKRMGDKLGSQLVDNFIRYLACGITNLINLFQPEVLCIGGGISNEGDNLIQHLIKIVEKERYSRYSTSQTKICTAKLKNDAGVIGAALLDES